MGWAGVVSCSFDWFIVRRRCTVIGIQRAMLRSSMLLRIRAIQERIGVEGVANVGERGHFGSVDSMITVNRVKVVSGAGGRFD